MSKYNDSINVLLSLLQFYDPDNKFTDYNITNSYIYMEN